MVGGGAKKLFKKILICIVLGVNLGFTRIQFFQHMFLKKTKKEPRGGPFLNMSKNEKKNFFFHLTKYAYLRHSMTRNYWYSNFRNSTLAALPFTVRPSQNINSLLFDNACR